MSVAFKGEEDKVRVRKGRKECAGLIGVVESRQYKRRVAPREDGKEEHGGTRGELNNIPELIEDVVRSA